MVATVAAISPAPALWAVCSDPALGSSGSAPGSGRDAEQGVRPVWDGLVKGDGRAGADDAVDREDRVGDRVQVVRALRDDLHEDVGVAGGVVRRDDLGHLQEPGHDAGVGLMQQLFSAGGVAGPAIAAWLVTLTGSWQSMWWMTCTFAGLGGLLSLYLSERRLQITLAPRQTGCQPATAAAGQRPAGPAGQPAHA